MLHCTFYKLLENRQPVYFQAICRMYHVIFPCTARTNNDVAVLPATKVASCMVGFRDTTLYREQLTWDMFDKGELHCNLTHTQACTHVHAHIPENVLRTIETSYVQIYM